jgi:hypothetical protein
MSIIDFRLEHSPGLTVMMVLSIAVATIVFLNSSNVTRTSAAKITADEKYIRGLYSVVRAVINQ